ncbi:helicase-related protein [Sphingomonas faeni]
MPTGAGKSLLFQLAALHGRRHRPGACVIVITPTIALALDHERTLATMSGLEGSRALTGDLTPDAAGQVIAGFRRGEVPILLISPEKALQEAIIPSLIEAAADETSFAGLDARLTHVFVDEAHIVESWGRSFRPDFQRLPALLARLRQANPEVRLVLLSATLTPAAKEVLRRGWQFDGDWLEIDARVPRLEHDVVVASFDYEAERLEALDWTLDRAPRPAIVYTTEVAAAEQLFAHLSDERGYGRIALFTGATGATARRDVVDRWAREELDIVVATSAFGMGVDKSNVRTVIHACLPESPSRWYQEIGRAARDGGQALSATLFTEMAGRDDKDRALDIATSGWLSIDLGKPRWEALLQSASDKRWLGGAFRMSVDLDALREGLGPASSDYNRGWNMALLTLMQRSGSIRIVSVRSDGDQATGTWDVEVVEPSLLEGSDGAAWTSIFAVRESERRDALAEVVPFIDLMRNPRRSCVTRTVFEMIEPGSYAPPCGRCPACRSDGVAPPTGLRSEGMEKVWSVSEGYSGPLPAGVMLVEPADPTFSVRFPELLQRLVDVGVQQFVVGADQAAETVAILAEVDLGPGLVIAHEDWTGGVQLASVATAMLLPASPRLAETMSSRFLAWSGQRGGIPAVMVGRRDRSLGGRRLDQFASPHAPILESRLDAWSFSPMNLESSQ